MFLSTLAELPYSIEYITSKTAGLKTHWDKFQRIYKPNFNILADMYTDQNRECNPITTDILNHLKGIKQEQQVKKPNQFLTFLMKELANNKIIGKLDENC